jgi:hypothetical protein
MMMMMMIMIIIIIIITVQKKCHAKRSRKETRMQELMYRDIRNVEHEMYNYNGNKWSDRNSNERFIELFVSHNRKTFNRLTTKDTCTWNITHNTESTAV